MLSAAVANRSPASSPAGRNALETASIEFTTGMRPDQLRAIYRNQFNPRPPGRTRCSVPEPDSVDLDRRFTHLMAGQDADKEAEFAGDANSDTDWSKLLELPRVVLLAEAGAGKTTEMQTRARCLSAGGQFAFYATVQDVAKEDLEGALDPPQATGFRAWRESDLSAWLFLDSVDEAKLDNISLRRALRKVASSIAGAERRAKILLSSRYTDWDAIVDLRSFEELLPPPAPDDLPPAPDANEIFSHVMRQERLPERTVRRSGPAVFVMAALDEPRIRKYARGKAIEGIDAFMTSIATAGLWRFARRPLDLGWMVDLWRTNQRLGSLSEAIKASLDARLCEPNPIHGRQDPLNTRHCWDALERIGGAMVFGRAATVDILSDPTDLTPHPGALDLTKVLPDWSSSDIHRLLTRAVFDPSTFGRSRLHNDNEGEVRAYLAARWLRRMRAANCPISVILDLLFADVYGLALVRPTSTSTAAWLALWDDDVAQAITDRAPSILIEYGDPASLSVTRRTAVLEAVIRLVIASPNSAPVLDHDKLRRFTTTNLTGAIHVLWELHSVCTPVRQLLLMMISLGSLPSFNDLASSVAYGSYPDVTSRFFAGRVLMSSGDHEVVGDYAAYIRSHVSEIAPTVVWDAVSRLFPDVLTVENLLSILESADECGSKPRWCGGDLASKLNTAGDLLAFLRGLLARAQANQGGSTDPRSYYDDDSVSGIAVALVRLLERTPEYEVPLDAVDAYLWLNSDHQNRRLQSHSNDVIKFELNRTGARRRTVFWRAAESLRSHRLARGIDVLSPWVLQYLGWPAGLSQQDLGWLLHDARCRTELSERNLALSTIHWVWAENGASQQELAQIRQSIQDDANLVEQLESWLSPKTKSEEQTRLAEEMALLRTSHETEQKQRDDSWRRFISEMRASPELVSEAAKPPECVSQGLFWLWKLASAVCCPANRYSLQTLTPIEPLFGPTLTRVVTDGLVSFWRTWTPTLRTSRPAELQHQVSQVDCLGLAGIGLEAAASEAWAVEIDAYSATLATRYATIEMNGFPPWIEALARAKPSEVCQVLIGEVDRELDEPPGFPRVAVLENIARAGDSVVAALAAGLFSLLSARAQVQAHTLKHLVDALSHVTAHGTVQGAEVVSLAVNRLSVETNLELCAEYAVLAFAYDAAEAVAALRRRLGGLTPLDQTAFALYLLPRLFGDAFEDSSALKASVPFEIVHQLVLLAFRTVRLDEDEDRQPGIVFTAGARFSAESARSKALRMMADISGAATYAALMAMRNIPEFGVAERFLGSLANQRALNDAELPAWLPHAAVDFEREHEHAPAAPTELQRLVIRRLEDVQHSLLHDDFAQRHVFARLENETEVQNWIADRLRVLQKNSYTVQREAHRLDEKEPDIVITATASDSTLAIEVKVAESWSFPELKEALLGQLCGQYLRSATGRHGLLLLVHQVPRRLGWRNYEGNFKSFDVVVTTLTGLARSIAAQTNDGPKPMIAVINVSECT